MYLHAPSSLLRFNVVFIKKFRKRYETAAKILKGIRSK